MSVILLILPDFLLIALGWLLLHRFGFDRHFFAQAEKLVYFVLFPALLFHSITQAPMALGSTTVLLAATMGVMLGGIALAWLGRLAVRPDAGAHAATAQCAFRFNSYLALSLAASLGWDQAQATMAVILGFAVPISNVGAVHALASRNGGRALNEMARNPFILATLAALACNFLQMPIPHLADVALGRLGSCAIALGLLCVGATLSLEGGTPACAADGLDDHGQADPAAAMDAGAGLDAGPARPGTPGAAAVFRRADLVRRARAGRPHGRRRAAGGGHDVAGDAAVGGDAAGMAGAGGVNRDSRPADTSPHDGSAADIQCPTDRNA